MLLSKMMSLDLLREMIDQRMINVGVHPTKDLFILSYSHACQYGHAWNEATTQCRGLIVQGDPRLADSTIVARSFPKFFNVAEHQDNNEKGTLPDLPFEVYDKADGSLAILYRTNQGLSIATRGSFTSEQAIWATSFFHKHYSHADIPHGVTLLFEIIYPANRIVVDYHGREELILLAAIDNETGADVDTEQFDYVFQRVTKYDGVKDSEAIAALLAEKDAAGEEGLVIRFIPEDENAPSIRAKIKAPEYVRLHRIVTGVSSKTIWECLANGQPLDDIIDRVPDEFFDWVKATVKDLRDQFEAIEAEALALYACRPLDVFRREIAEHFTTKENKPYASLCFAMLDDKDYASMIWKQIKPEFARPFTVDTDA